MNSVNNDYYTLSIFLSSIILSMWDEKIWTTFPEIREGSGTY